MNVVVRRDAVIAPVALLDAAAALAELADGGEDVTLVLVGAGKNVTQPAQARTSGVDTMRIGDKVTVPPLGNLHPHRQRAARQICSADNGTTRNTR